MGTLTRVEAMLELLEELRDTWPTDWPKPGEGLCMQFEDFFDWLGPTGYEPGDYFIPPEHVDVGYPLPGGIDAYENFVTDSVNAPDEYLTPEHPYMTARLDLLDDCIEWVEELATQEGE